MAFQSAPNTVEVDVRATWLGERVENTLYFETVATPTGLVVQEIAEQIGGLWATEMMAQLGASYVLTEIYARSLNTEAAPEYTDTTNAGDTGALGGAAMPGNVTWTVKFLTGLTGRSFRGRNYFPGFVEAQCIGNEVDHDTGNAIVLAYSHILTVQADFDWVWVVLSRVQDGVTLPNAIGAPVTQVSFTDYFLDSQRRRLAGRGT